MMRRRLDRRAATLSLTLAGLALGGCMDVVPPTSLGFRCDDTHSCSAGLVCTRSVCSAPDPQPAQPWRLATFLGTFPDDWHDGTADLPSLGEYASNDGGVILEQLAALGWARMSAGLYSWDGPGTDSDAAFRAALALTPGTGLHWALWAQQGLLNPLDAGTAEATLAQVSSLALEQSAVLRLGERPVVFLASPDPTDPCALADVWVPTAQRQQPAPYLVLRTGHSATAYATCARQPDAWYQYSGADAVTVRAQSYALLPGAAVAGKPATVPRELSAWTQEVEAMVASGAPLQLVTSFNDWAHGTEVESAQAWPSDSGFGAYLDVLHQNP